MTLPDGTWRALLAAIGLAVAALACGPIVPPSTAPAGLETDVVNLPPPGAVRAVACIDIDPPECTAVTRAVLARLPAEQGDPFSIQIRLLRCASGAEACPRSLAVRSGVAIVEYPDGAEPVAMRLEGPPAGPVITEKLDDVWTDAIQPGSPQVDAAGPFEFEVGHCGLLHVIDFDASFWVLVGDIEGEHQALTNSELGAIRLVNQETARYTGTGNEQFELARFPGAKRFQLCD